MAVDSEPKLNLLILGDYEVGKTTLVQRYLEGKFPETIKPTVGVALMSKIKSIRGQPTKIQIWDTAGQVSENFVVMAS